MNRCGSRGGTGRPPSPLPLPYTVAGEVSPGGQAATTGKAHRERVGPWVGGALWSASPRRPRPPVPRRPVPRPRVGPPAGHFARKRRPNDQNVRRRRRFPGLSDVRAIYRPQRKNAPEIPFAFARCGGSHPRFRALWRFALPLSRVVAIRTPAFEIRTFRRFRARTADRGTPQHAPSHPLNAKHAPSQPPDPGSRSRRDRQSRRAPRLKAPVEIGRPCKPHGLKRRRRKR